MQRVILLCLLLIFASNAHAQTDSGSPRFAVTVSAAAAAHEPGRWKSSFVRPGYAVNAGLVYGPIRVADLARLFLSAEVGYSWVRSEDYPFSWHGVTESAYTRWKRLPVMAWATLTTASSFSPHVRAGLGTMNVQLDEPHPTPSPYDISLHYWTFGWGVGGGMEWAVSSTMRISVFLDYVVGEGTHTNEYNVGIHERTVISPVGLRGTFTL